MSLILRVFIQKIASDLKVFFYLLFIKNKSLVPAISEYETDVYLFTVNNFALGFGFFFHFCLVSLFLPVYLLELPFYLFVYLFLVNGSSSVYLVEI